MNIDVILCCYNQQNTIEKALRSIYAQEAGANIHLIVADDCSTDSTLEIIEKITPPYSVETEILGKEPNLGISKNYIRAFKKCVGKYVFILEGDDWWLPNHIQQHLDFLDSHPDYSMSANVVSKYDVSSSKITYSYSEAQQNLISYRLEDQIQYNRLGNLSACCFRGELIRKLPDKLVKYQFADWLLGMIMAEAGPLAVLPESTSVWRISGKSSWTGLSGREVRKHTQRGYSIYNEYFGYKYNSLFEEAKKPYSRPSLNLHSWRDFVPKAMIRLTKLILFKL